MTTSSALMIVIGVLIGVPAILLACFGMYVACARIYNAITRWVSRPHVVAERRGWKRRLARQEETAARREDACVQRAIQGTNSGWQHSTALMLQYLEHRANEDRRLLFQALQGTTGDTPGPPPTLGVSSPTPTQKLPAFEFLN